MNNPSTGITVENNVRGWTFRDLTIQRVMESGIEFIPTTSNHTGDDGIVVDNVNFDSGNHQLYFNPILGRGVYRTIVTNSHFSGALLNNIYVANASPHSLIIANNVFQSANRDCIRYVSASRWGIIANNRFEVCSNYPQVTYSAISLEDDAHDIVISGNVIGNAATEHGVSIITHATNIAITGNVFTNLHGTALNLTTDGTVVHTGNVGAGE